MGGQDRDLMGIRPEQIREQELSCCSDAEGENTANQRESFSPRALIWDGADADDYSSHSSETEAVKDGQKYDDGDHEVRETNLTQYRVRSSRLTDDGDMALRENRGRTAESLRKK